MNPEQITVAIGDQSITATPAEFEAALREAGYRLIQSNRLLFAKYSDAIARQDVALAAPKQQVALHEEMNARVLGGLVDKLLSVGAITFTTAEVKGTATAPALRIYDAMIVFVSPSVTPDKSEAN